MIWKDTEYFKCDYDTNLYSTIYGKKKKFHNNGQVQSNQDILILLMLNF